MSSTPLDGLFQPPAKGQEMSEKSKAEPVNNIVNCLRELRVERGLSQGILADRAGVTRQAICAIESHHYLPTTAVALRLAAALGCQVEDLFSLVSTGEVVEGEWGGVSGSTGETGRAGQGHGTGQGIGQGTGIGTGPVRVKVAKVGSRFVVQPVAALGEVLNYTVPADGLVMPTRLPRGGVKSQTGRVHVCLLRGRDEVEREVAVAGCDPAIFLAGEYLRRRKDGSTVVGWSMGSSAAVDALKRREVHVAGLHVVDAKTGESNLPFLRTHFSAREVTVITFASWEQGLLVRPGNPKGVRGVADLARKEMRLLNREAGAGARLLLDQRLAAAGIKPSQVLGYDRLASSHLEVGRAVAMGQADVGMGLRSVARLLGLEFLPLQEERYDLVVMSADLKDHPSLSRLIDTLVSRPFRSEIDALGGYDTSETGKVHELGKTPSGRSVR